MYYSSAQSTELGAALRGNVAQGAWESLVDSSDCGGSWRGYRKGETGALCARCAGPRVEHLRAAVVALSFRDFSLSVSLLRLWTVPPTHFVLTPPPPLCASPPQLSAASLISADVTSDGTCVLSVRALLDLSNRSGFSP